MSEKKMASLSFGVSHLYVKVVFFRAILGTVIIFLCKECSLFVGNPFFFFPSSVN